MKYTAITIGPIHKTLQNVKSTKAIWAASYMFSYLMKNLLIKAKLTSDDVLLPFFESSDLTTRFGVGLIPDRIIIKKHIDNIDDIAKDVIKDFASKVAGDIGENNNEVTDFLLEYIHIHTFRIDLSNDDLQKNNSNVIFKINDLLDTAELKQRVLSNADSDYLYTFFEEKLYNFLINEEFDTSSKRFPSTIEIATAEYSSDNLRKYKRAVQKLFTDSDSVDNQQTFINEIKQDSLFKNTYRNYQKYISIIQADGDNIGNFIKQLYNEPNKDKLLKQFSKNLLEFGKQAVEKIKAYKGTPIYAGGDDLLFFSPVAHTKINEKTDKVEIDKTYLNLIGDIDNIFDELFTDNDAFKSIIDKVDKKPSMSYGVSISYFKFPLNEALEQGANQLFGIAKKTDSKNAVSYSVLKHSGQFFGTTFFKHLASYQTYLKLLKEQVSDDNYLHGIVYKLKPQEMVFCRIGKEKNETKRNEMFDNFFKNNFDESEHTKKVNGKKELIPFLKTLKQLFKDVYSENQVFKSEKEENEKNINNKNLNMIYAGLRFIGFLHNKEER